MYGNKRPHIRNTWPYATCMDKLDQYYWDWEWRKVAQNKTTCSKRNLMQFIDLFPRICFFHVLKLIKFNQRTKEKYTLGSWGGVGQDLRSTLGEKIANVWKLQQ